MVKLIYRRAGHPRVVYADPALPFNPNLGAAGLNMEVAAVSNWTAVTTGALSSTAVAPAAAKNMGQYNLSEGTGAVAGDSSSFATAGAISGTTGGRWAAGGYEFDGAFTSNHIITVPYAASMNSTSLHLFVVFRAKASPGDSGTNRAFACRLTEGGERLWMMTYRKTDNNLAMRIIGNPIINAPANSVVLGEWHLYEVEVSGRTVILRINGTEVHRETAIIDLPTGTRPLTIGNEPGSLVSSPPGTFGYVRAFNNALTAGEAAFVRNQAREVMTAKNITLPTLAAPVPAKAPVFTAAPSMSTDSTPAQTPITLGMGRAKGDPHPITDLSVTLNGVDITPAEGLVVTPQTGGRLLAHFTADNGIYQPKTITLGADISTYYPILTKAQIQSALGITEDMLLTDGLAGFPGDMSWSPSNLVDGSAALDASVLGVRIRKNPAGSTRKYGGGEINISRTHRLGRYDAMLRLHEGVPGTVQTVFMYMPNSTDKHREFDFEILSDGHVPVQGDTTTTFSATCRADCAIHMQPLTTGGNQHIKVQCDVPKEAFTAFQKWSIVYNGDRTEWLFQDRLMARYIQGQGFDESIQEFNPTREGTTTRYNSADVTTNGKHILPTDAGWHVGNIKPFIQHWCSDLNPDWIGKINLPPDPPLFRVDGTAFSPFFNTTIGFVAADWSVSRTAITVNAMRIPGFRPTAIQYSTDGGTVWTDLPNSTGSGTYAVTLAAATNVIIRPRVRVVNGRLDNGVVSDFVLEGANSDTKTVA